MNFLKNGYSASSLSACEDASFNESSTTRARSFIARVAAAQLALTARSGMSASK